MNSGPYYDTTHADADELAKYRAQAGSQDEAVLNFFRDHVNQRFTAENIQAMVLPGAPLTSVRRALSNLRGYLTKEGKTKGKYGRPIYKWAFVIEQPKQKDLFC